MVDRGNRRINQKEENSMVKLPCNETQQYTERKEKHGHNDKNGQKRTMHKMETDYKGHQKLYYRNRKS